VTAGVLNFTHGKETFQNTGGRLGLFRRFEDEGLAEVRIGQIGMGGDGLVKEGQRLLAATGLLGEGGEAVQRPGVVGIEFEGLADELLSRSGSFFATGVEVAEHDPVPRVGGIETQHFDEVVRRVFHVAGLGVDHGQVATRPVKGRLELEDPLVDVDGLAVVALAGAFAGLLGQTGCLGTGACGFSGNSTMTSSPSTFTVMGWGRKVNCFRT
jgi:hypothetical protein